MPRFKTAAVVAALLFLSACGADSVVNTGPRINGLTSMSVAFERPAHLVALVVSCTVEVSAPDMETIVAKLDVAQDMVSGTIEGIPAGQNRVFTVSCYDGEGTLTYQGSKTIDVVAGSIQNLSIVLYPVDGTGTVIVTGTFADFPQTGELIAFNADYEGNHDIYTISPSGHNLTQLTFSGANEVQPEISPDKSKIVYIHRVGTIPSGGSARPYLMNIDGSGAHDIGFLPELNVAYCAWSPDGTKLVAHCIEDFGTTHYMYVYDFSTDQVTQIQPNTYRNWEGDWSPDGQTISFSSDRSGLFRAHLISPDGMNLRRLTPNDNWEEHRPKFSPDGTKIAFGGRVAYTADDWALFVVGVDGSNLSILTDTVIDEYSPVWSPNGDRLVFTGRDHGLGDYGLYLVNADGSGLTMLLDTPYIEDNPSWR